MNFQAVKKAVREHPLTVTCRWSPMRSADFGKLEKTSFAWRRHWASGPITQSQLPECCSEYVSGRISRSSLSSIYGSPAHRSATLIWLFDPPRSRSAARPDLRRGGGESGPQIFPLTGAIPLIFFISLISYKIRKCILFTDSHLLTWYLPLSGSQTSHQPVLGSSYSNVRYCN